MIIISEDHTQTELLVNRHCVLLGHSSGLVVSHVTDHCNNLCSVSRILSQNYKVSHFLSPIFSWLFQESLCYSRLYYIEPLATMFGLFTIIVESLSGQILTIMYWLINCTLLILVLLVFFSETAGAAPACNDITLSLLITSVSCLSSLISVSILISINICIINWLNYKLELCNKEMSHPQTT